MRKKNIPRFKNEDEEREFWHKEDSTEYIDWNKAQNIVMPNLKPSSKSVSIRMPETLLNDIKLLANKKGVPYQSLIKVFLAEKVKEEVKI